MPTKQAGASPSGQERPTAGEILLRERPDLRDRVVAARVEGRLVDLSRPVEAGSRVEPVEIGSPEGVDTLRHSTSHLMAQAVQELFPGTQVTLGPTIEDGFYYDFARAEPFHPEDLERIEARMREIAQRDLTIERMEWPKERAVEEFRGRGERYKVEIIEGIPDPTVSLYRQGDWMDLCRGPHLPSTGWIRSFKLLRLAGAYWRGDEHNPMLQRIYGTAFATPEALETHLKRLAEAERRDHRRLGKDLDLFSIHEEAGPGLVFWHPKGAAVRKEIEDFWRTVHQRAGYDLVYTPHMARVDLWKTSGHWDFYRENMFGALEVEDVAYTVKPMNCPFHILIYRSRVRSYRDLPLRFAELGTVYRYERSGVMHGLLRVRGFTQDDAHLFCAPEDLERELIEVMRLALSTLKAFGFTEFQVFLATRPDKKLVGTPEIWDRAEAALRTASREAGLSPTEDPGGGAFYGPKIDLKIKDSLGRAWQCGTIQLDFNFPERFGLEYIGSDNRPHRPIMIHRALLGSIERFFAILIEHYGGDFPLWLAPIQARIATVSREAAPYGDEVLRALRAAGLRADADLSDEKLGAKIRTAQLEKIPWTVVLGRKEAETRTVSPRSRKGEEMRGVPLETWLARMREEIAAGPHPQ